jgi:hypothetical protein
MKKDKRILSDYSVTEVGQFDEMHNVLSRYNKLLATKMKLTLPEYSDDEMAAYSIYREILISETSDIDVDK